MKMDDVKAIAKAQGIKAGTMKKTELIRAIQASEGNNSCYNTCPVTAIFVVHEVLKWLQDNGGVAEMQKVMPEIKQIQDRYKKYSMRDPRQQEKNNEVMAVYKREGINPMGSCLPMLLQMPIWIALFSMLGAANQNMLTSPRVYFAMARDGMFFKKIAEVHPKFLTPHVSIIAITVWAILLTLTGTFSQLFTYVIFGEWIFFGMTVASVIVLRVKKPSLERPYKTWGYPVVPILFLAAAAFLLVNALVSDRNSWIPFGVIVAGIPVYFVWRRTAGAAERS